MKQVFTSKPRPNSLWYHSCYIDSLAEWSKALASGASPQGRGFEPHSCHAIARDRRAWPLRVFLLPLEFVFARMDLRIAFFFPHIWCYFFPSMCISHATCGTYRALSRFHVIFNTSWPSYDGVFSIPTLPDTPRFR